MPATISHSLSMTTPNNAAYENQPQHWNQAHAFTINATGSEISNAFSNANGISFGTSGGAITASHNAITTARASTDAIGLNTALTAGPLAWTVNSSGLSLNAGSAAGTTSGFGGNLISGSMTHNTAGLNLSLNHPAWLTTAMASNAATISNVRISAGTTSNLLSALTFGDANGLVFGINASTITGSYTVPTQTNQTIGIYGSSQTTGSASSGTMDARSLSIMGAGIISVGMHSTSVGGTTTGLLISATQSNQAVSNSAGSFTFQTLNFSNANNVTFGTSAGGIITASVAAPGAAAENNWVNLLGANTAGNTTASGSTIGYSGINLTLSGTNNSVVNISAPATSSLVGTNGIAISSNGSTISVSMVPASYFSFPIAPFAGTTSLTLGISSNFVQPFALENPISCSYIRIPVSQGFGSTSQTTGGAASATFDVTHTYFVQFLTQQGGASSNSIAVAYSTTQTSRMRIQISLSATNGQTISHLFTYPATGNSSVGFTTNAAPSNASLQISTTHLTSFNGARFLDIPFATLMTPGNYWMALQLSSASASTSAGVNYSNITAATMRNSFYAVSQISGNICPMGADTAVIGSVPWAGAGHGWWTTNSSGATTTQMGLGSISTIANQPLVPFILSRQV